MPAPTPPTRRLIVASSPLQCLALALLAGGLLAACGCSKKEGGKVTGRVLLNGQPLGGARVQFLSKENGVAANVAVTDADGKFEIRRDRGGRTLLPGTYNVLISKYVGKDGKESADEDSQMLAISGTGQNLVPARFSSTEKPELTVEIKPGDNDLPPFDLKK